MQSKDYKKVFSSKHYCFDDYNFLFAEPQNDGNIFDCPDNIQGMPRVVKKAEGKFKTFLDFIIVEGSPVNIKWGNGKII